MLELLDNATSQSDLTSYPGASYQYLLGRVIPDPDPFHDDCGPGTDCAPYDHPTHILIDLSNMQVQRGLQGARCNPWPYADHSTWEQCVAPYL